MTGPDLSGAQPAPPSVVLLGLPPRLLSERADAWETALTRVWGAQTGRHPGALADDLSSLAPIFNPAVKGETLRQALDDVPSVDLSDLAEELPVAPGTDGDPAAGDGDGGRFLMPVAGGRVVVTPDGRALLECLRTASRDGATVRLDDDECLRAAAAVMSLLRGWSAGRVADASALLDGSGAGSMRPAVLGLLMILLVNRNTSPERALPKTRDRAAGASVTKALALPVSAFAQALTGGETDAGRAVDIYRGWAWGELARRLGKGLHNDFDGGIWLDPRDEDAALARLCDELSKRPQKVRARVPEAIRAALAVYEDQRTYLTALGVVHERPSRTRRIVEAAASAAGAAGSGSGVGR